MNKHEKIPNCMILLCDEQGTVTEVEFPRPPEVIASYFLIGESFTSRIEESSLQKALDFLIELKEKEQCYGYEINYLIEDTIEILQLSGYFRNPEYVLMITSETHELMHLNRELMKINNEQMNRLRREIKSSMKDKGEESTFFYNEISKLNNEVINTQREIERKSHELKELNRELQKLVIKDPMTGLFNRRTLAERFKSEKARAKRLNYPMTLMMIDVNDFKQVNDTMGHSKGDELLKTLAEIIQTTTRDGLDHSYRVGGDEFLLVLSDCSEENAEEIAKRIDEEFEKHTEIASLSYGITGVDIESDEPFDTCYSRVDQLMYEDKKRRKQ